MSSNWSEILEQHRAQLRRQILAAALELLRERGMAGLTMSALAQRAGISRPTLYHHFADVDAVLAAWVGDEMQRSLDTLFREATKISDPLDRLRYLIDAQLHTFASLDHRLGAEQFESEASPPSVRREVSRRMAPLRRLLKETILEAERAGIFDSDIDAELASDFVLGLLGAARRRLVSGTLAPSATTDSVMRLLQVGWGRR